MVITVICMNLSLSAVGFWVAWRIWRLRRRLRRIAQVLVMAEKRCDRVLSPAPGYIIRGQRGSRRLRLRYTLLAQQWAKVEQLLFIVSLVEGIWRRRSRRIVDS